MIKVTITHADSTLVIESDWIESASPSHPPKSSVPASENSANKLGNNWRRLGAAVLSGTFVPIEVPTNTVRRVHRESH